MENGSAENISGPGAGLPRGERLRGRTAVDGLFREGAGGFVYPLRYVYTVADAAAEGEAGAVRILFSVPKRYHKRAVKRNLLKRRSREAYRQAKAPLTARVAAKGVSLNVALIYSSKEVESYSRIDNAVRKIISQLQERL